MIISLFCAENKVQLFVILNKETSLFNGHQAQLLVINAAEICDCIFYS